MEDNKNHIKLHPKISKAKLSHVKTEIEVWTEVLCHCTFNYVAYAIVKSLELLCQPIRLSFVIFNIYTYIIKTKYLGSRARCFVTEIVRPHGVTSQKAVILVFSTLRLTNPYVWNIWILLLSFISERQQRDCITALLTFFIDGQSCRTAVTASRNGYSVCSCSCKLWYFVLLTAHCSTLFSALTALCLVIVSCCRSSTKSTGSL